ncbi:MAG: hypothetical protein ABEJ65_02765 [bacterium]
MTAADSFFKRNSPPQNPASAKKRSMDFRKEIEAESNFSSLVTSLIHAYECITLTGEEFAMRTTVEIDDESGEELIKMSAEKGYSTLTNEAMREYIDGRKEPGIQYGGDTAANRE